MARSDSKTPTRVACLDWLRLLAALQMITGHTVDAVLEDSARVGVLFEAWTQLRGLTAPAFLVASGMSFGLAARLDDAGAYAALRAREGARRRRVLRSAWLIGLGVLLHAFDAPWVVDVLHCVGATLLLLDGLVTCLPRPRSLVAISAAIALAIVTVALPLEQRLSAVDHTGPARWWLAWIDREGGSLFPLVPWAAYVFGGLVVGQLAIPLGARTEGRVVRLRLAFAASASLGLSTMLGALASRGVIDAPDASNWSAHPVIVLERFGLVLVALAALSAIAERWVLPAWGDTLAGETLALYVVHLLVLYADGIGPGRLWPHALPLLAALALAALMVALSIAVALVWAARWPPLERRWLPWLRAGGEREGLRSAPTTAKNE